jgi:beta-1,4-N-acetylglucosaminyltransferase
MKICLVCGHGGHFVEMKTIEKVYQDKNHFFVTYDSIETRNLKNAHFIKGKAWKKLTGKLNEINIFLEAFKILRKERPDVLITTGGGGIAVPFCYVGKLYGVIIIYLESLTRITEKSAGGRLIYPISDLFLVQWKGMKKLYGKKAKYWGKVL